MPIAQQQPNWQAFVPPGFILEGRGLRRLNLNGHWVEQATYSDGLASYSVFVAQTVRAASGTPARLHRWGAMTAAEQIRTDGLTHVRVSVLGSIPLETTLQILSSWRINGT